MADVERGHTQPSGPPLAAVHVPPPAGLRAPSQSAAQVTDVFPYHHQQQRRYHNRLARALLNWLVIPLCLPGILALWAVALVVALFATAAILPSILMARRAYWALPFVPHIWQAMAAQNKRGSRIGALMARLAFEGGHCTTVLARLLSLPLRPNLPDFYLLGFPVGTSGCL